MHNYKSAWELDTLKLMADGQWIILMLISQTVRTHFYTPWREALATNLIGTTRRMPCPPYNPYRVSIRRTEWPWYSYRMSRYLVDQRWRIWGELTALKNNHRHFYSPWLYNQVMQMKLRRPDFTSSVFRSSVRSTLNPVNSSPCSWCRTAWPSYIFIHVQAKHLQLQRHFGKQTQDMQQKHPTAWIREFQPLRSDIILSWSHSRCPCQDFGPAAELWSIYTSRASKANNTNTSFWYWPMLCVLITSLCRDWWDSRRWGLNSSYNYRCPKVMTCHMSSSYELLLCTFPETLLRSYIFLLFFLLFWSLFQYRECLTWQIRHDAQSWQNLEWHFFFYRYTAMLSSLLNRNIFLVIKWLRHVRHNILISLLVYPQNRDSSQRLRNS